jgi:hypothetical protein
MRRRGCLLAAPGLLAIAGLLFAPSTSHAYIDPGTGGLYVQMLVASVAAGGTAVALYWKRLIGRLRRRPDAPPLSPPSPPSSSATRNGED